MEQLNNSTSMVDMFMYPVFRVKDNIIIEANQPAQQRQISVGSSVTDLLVTGHQEYAAFDGGCLSLSLSAGDITYIAAVIRCEESDLFHLRSEHISPELRTLALAAQNMNKPLSNILNIADQLFAEDTFLNDPEKQNQASQINRGLYQLLRMIKNMEAAGGSNVTANLATVDIVGVFDEVLRKVTAAQRGRTLNIKLPSEVIYCLADDVLLERAIYNLISNAIKFSPADSMIQAELIHHDGKLRFSVQNQHDRKNQELMGSVYLRYLREPGIEDGRNGLGLGIPMIQAAAAAHGGTLLLDHPGPDTVRFTMTIAVRNNKAGTLSNNIMLFDYAGGYDKLLLELSDVLPSSEYAQIN